jgi:hypothetical protein
LAVVRREHQNPHGDASFGNPISFRLIAGHCGDVPRWATLIAGLPAAVELAGGAYDATHLRNTIAAISHPLHPSKLQESDTRQASKTKKHDLHGQDSHH